MRKLCTSPFQGPSQTCLGVCRISVCALSCMPSPHARIALQGLHSQTAASAVLPLVCIETSNGYGSNHVSTLSPSPLAAVHTRDHTLRRLASTADIRAKGACDSQWQYSHPRLHPFKAAPFAHTCTAAGFLVTMKSLCRMAAGAGRRHG